MMDSKLIRGLLRALFSSMIFVVLLFWSAGDPGWGAGWLYALILIGGALANVILLVIFSPDLLRERGTNPENYPLWDRLLGAGMAIIGPVLLVIVSGLDHRNEVSGSFAWWVVMLSMLVMITGQVITNWAMVVNRFFSGAVHIQHRRGHRVISSGPYAWVRHPGYLGYLLFNLATPFLLSSWWGLVVALIIAGMVLARTRLEDEILQRELPGYRKYSKEVRYRLMPLIW